MIDRPDVARHDYQEALAALNIVDGDGERRRRYSLNDAAEREAGVREARKARLAQIAGMAEKQRPILPKPPIPAAGY